MKAFMVKLTSHIIWIVLAIWQPSH